MKSVLAFYLSMAMASSFVSLLYSFVWSSTLWYFSKHRSPLQRELSVVGVSPSSAFFPSWSLDFNTHSYSINLMPSPYNEILYINIIHSHFCYYCNLFHLFIYEALKYNRCRTSVEICHDAQEMLRVLCALPFPVCAGPAHPLMFTVLVQSYSHSSLTSSLTVSELWWHWPQEISCWSRHRGLVLSGIHPDCLEHLFGSSWPPSNSLSSHVSAL